MKVIKFVIIASFCFAFNIVSIINPKIVFAARTYYAQVPNNDTFLFSSPDSIEQSRLFVLPQTYFVELLKNANENFYYARYNDVYGYVLKNEVKPVKNVPTSPFLSNINFRIFVPSGANLRSSPYNNGTINLVYSIPFLDSNLLYYGVAYGEEAISRKGNCWYYCKYFTSNLTYTGYVYSPLCDSLSSITPNTETVEYLESITFEDETTQVSGDVFKGLSQTTTTLLIIAISLPCLLFIYLLFKPTKLAQEVGDESKPRKKHQRKKIKRLKNSDYFEFDDDF